jgi:hypothetical protein
VSASFARARFTATRGDHQGETIRRNEVVVDEIAVALRFASATVRKAAHALGNPAQESV